MELNMPLPNKMALEAEVLQKHTLEVHTSY